MKQATSDSGISPGLKLAIDEMLKAGESHETIIALCAGRGSLNSASREVLDAVKAYLKMKGTPCESKQS